MTTTVLQDSQIAASPSADTSARDPYVGYVLKGRFKLLERVSLGGMSTVYKAVDQRKLEPLVGEPYVAVKIMNAGLGRHPDAFGALQRETEKMQALGHQNIVRVFDCDRDGETVFMTMEYLSGRALKRRAGADDADITKDEALRIIGDVGSALSFAHRNGVIHGDLKPSNVMITDAGVVKVIDFGIARVLPQSVEELSATTPDSGTIGALTPPYASPEMLENRAPDPRDDVYGLACVAYWLLTGRHPFDGESATVARDSGLKPDAHPRLSRREYCALAAGLAFEREARTPTIEQLLEDMRPQMTTDRRFGLLAAGFGAVAALVALYSLATRPSLEEPTELGSADRASAELAAGDVFRDCAACPQMVVLPAGRFVQGSSEADAAFHPSELPAREVVIGRQIAVGRYEVTVREYRAFAEATGRWSSGCNVYDGGWRLGNAHGWSDAAYAQAATHPVTCVSWEDASAYVAWLTEKTAKPYRLLSASEWEYAARGGTEGAAGESPACESANVADKTAAERYRGWTVRECTDGYVYTAPVGSFTPNTFGLHDMFGNVFEWIDDCWHEDYRGAPADGSTWQGGDCNYRELRGGSWFTAPSYVRAPFRNRFAPDYRGSSFGFRVARDLAQ